VVLPELGGPITATVLGAVREPGNGIVAVVVPQLWQSLQPAITPSVYPA
jgi:hypothetical protein